MALLDAIAKDWEYKQREIERIDEIWREVLFHFEQDILNLGAGLRVEHKDATVREVGRYDSVRLEPQVVNRHWRLRGNRGNEDLGIMISIVMPVYTTEIDVRRRSDAEIRDGLEEGLVRFLRAYLGLNLD